MTFPWIIQVTQKGAILQNLIVKKENLNKKILKTNK